MSITADTGQGTWAGIRDRPTVVPEDLCLHCHQCGRRRFPGKHGGWRLISHEPLVVECPYCEFGEQLMRHDSIATTQTYLRKNPARRQAQARGFRLGIGGLPA